MNHKYSPRLDRMRVGVGERSVGSIGEREGMDLMRRELELGSEPSKSARSLRGLTDVTCVEEGTDITRVGEGTHITRVEDGKGVTCVETGALGARKEGALAGWTGPSLSRARSLSIFVDKALSRGAPRSSETPTPP